MSNPLLETAKSQIPSSEEFGYRFTKTDEAIKKALIKAIQLIRKMRAMGHQARSWSTQLDLNTKNKMNSMKYSQSEESEKPLGTTSQKTTDINGWEINILQTIKRYMAESSELLSQMKSLNPPLSSEHLKPMIRAMEHERDATIASLNPLTERLDQLGQLKNQIRNGRFPIHSYSPVP